MEKLLKRPFLHYTLSGWWFCNVAPTVGQQGPPVLRLPRNHEEGAKCGSRCCANGKNVRVRPAGVFGPRQRSAILLSRLPGTAERGDRRDWEAPVLSPAQIQFVATELNAALKLLRREFPGAAHTCSIHGVCAGWIFRWSLIVSMSISTPMPIRVGPSGRNSPSSSKTGLFTNRAWHATSQRCGMTRNAIAPMLRARQRYKVAQFATWAKQRGAPFTTTESWASVVYCDTPDLDWVGCWNGELVSGRRH